MTKRICSAVLAGLIGISSTTLAQAAPLPAFTHARPQDWLNSRPLSTQELLGKVVLVEFWTFDCWNCDRTIPWVKSLEERFGPRGLTVIGVHTPELPQEYVLDNVRRKVAELGVTHPVMIDNDYSYWNALGNHYWPAFYLVDKRGQVRGVHVGETHAKDEAAGNVERQIETLIAEGS